MSMMQEENKTYQLIPGKDGDQHWLVRFIDGPFIETVVQYGAISINDVAEDTINFNFFVESSPDPDLNEENVELQEWCGDVLEAIIKTGIKDGSIHMKSKDELDES